MKNENHVICFRSEHWINWLACLMIWENWMPMLRQVLARSLLILEMFSKISVTNCLKTYWPITVSDCKCCLVDIVIELFLVLAAELSQYITRFQWDMAKYPIKQSLRNIADIISKQVGQIDADLKTKSQAYNSLKGNLQNLEKKQT